MKKNVLYLMSFVMTMFLVVNIESVNAQVTIGASDDPHPGAVLDLRTEKGLLLSRVALNDASVFQLSSAKTAEGEGMLIYNTNPNMKGGHGEGLYIWDGRNWTLIAKTEKYIPVNTITIRTDNNILTVAPEGTLQFLADIIPANATNQGLVWTVNPSSAGSIDAVTNVFTAGSTTGEVTITAKAAGETSVVSKLSIKIEKATSKGGTVTGKNGTYNTYDYGTLGTWMVENSKEGSGTLASATGYYYYKFNDAQNQNTCPSGYALPSSQQWANLAAYINSTTTPADEKVKWTDGTATGFYLNAPNGQPENPSISLWWTSHSSKVYIVLPSGKMQEDNSNDRWFAVRCIKQ